MNKKLMAIGIAAALAAPFVAQAGVEVYGDARMSVDFSDNGDNNTGQEKSKASVSSNASYIGFRGDEDLGNGMSAMYQLEQGVNWDTGHAFSEDRPTYVGIGGGFGTVMAGRFDTPYMTATDRYDIFIDTKADYNAIMGAAEGYGAIFDSRVSNTLVYATPDMSGFTGELAYVLSDAASGNDNLPTSKTTAKQDAYSASGNYDNGPLSLAAAYQVMSKIGGSGDDITGWKLGGSYTIMDATSLALIYENLDVGGNIKDRNAFYVNVAHKMGDTTLKLAYANADKCGGTAAACDKTGAQQISVGVSQSLTKNTEVYALYTQVSNDNNGDYGLAYGPSSVTKVDGTMSDVSSISFGVNHMFSSK
jgi:predicted porin